MFIIKLTKKIFKNIYVQCFIGFSDKFAYNIFDIVFFV